MRRSPAREPARLSPATAGSPQPGAPQARPRGRRRRRWVGLLLALVALAGLGAAWYEVHQTMPGWYARLWYPLEYEDAIRAEAARARQRAQLVHERAQLLGHRLGVRDQRIQVVERGAEVEERRVGAPHERRQLLDRVGQRGLLVADRGRRGGEVVDQAGEVLVAVGDVGDELGGGDDEALEQRGVAVELVEQAAGGGERRVEVDERLVHLLALALELLGGALEDVLEVLARLVVEGVEELVEVDRRGRRVLLDHAAVGDVRLLAPGSERST